MPVELLGVHRALREAGDERGERRAPQLGVRDDPDRVATLEPRGEGRDQRVVEGAGRGDIEREVREVRRPRTERGHGLGETIDVRDERGLRGRETHAPQLAAPDDDGRATLAPHQVLD